MRMLIVGGGPAAVAAADTASAAAKDVHVEILAGEPYAPYMRPRLAAGIANPPDIGGILIKPLSWYEKRGVTLRIGCRADAIMPDVKQVRAGDDILPYDSLILATGSSAVIPSVEGLDGDILTLRTYEDMLKIRAGLQGARRITVLGGGVLGLELAWEVREGSAVRVLETGGWLLSRQLTESASAFVRARLEEKGIEIITGVKTGDIPALAQGVVAAAAGVRPNTALAAEAGLSVERFGITVNKYMRTSQPDIFAAGDCACRQGVVTGFWAVATAMGVAAGANAAGQERVYTHKQPPAMMRVGHMSVLSVGNIAAPRKLKLVEANRCIEVLLEDKRIVGGIIIGDTTLGQRIAAAVSKGVETEAEDIEDVFRQLEVAR